MTDSEHRAKRVQAIARVNKMRRMGLVGAIDNDDGSVTLWRDEDVDPLSIVPDMVDLEAAETSYKAAEERGDRDW